MHALSMVGPKQEECGMYFPQVIEALEKSPILRPLMPWGDKSILRCKITDSDDGPIFWVRPGEQLIPTDDLKDEKRKRTSRGVNQLR